MNISKLIVAAFSLTTITLMSGCATPCLDDGPIRGECHLDDDGDASFNGDDTDGDDTDETGDDEGNTPDIPHRGENSEVPGCGTEVPEIPELRPCDPAGGGCGNDDGCRDESDDEPEGCTLTQGYWKTHHEQAENQSQQLPWPVDAQTDFCHTSGLDILLTPTNGDAWLILGHQYIAAELNVASGASTTCSVDVAMAEAEAFLRDCSIDDDEQASAIAIADLLDNYNNGLVGPGHCG